MKHATPSDYRQLLTSGIFPLAAFLLVTAMTMSAFARQSGELDPTFDGDGKRVERFIPGGGGDYGYSVLIRPDGRIVTVGQSYYEGTQVCSATRHFADGTLDLSFGIGGKIFLEPSSSIACASAVLQNDGKIVAAGYRMNGSNHDFAIVRYNFDGSLDMTFDGDGIVTTPITSNSGASAVAIQPDGKIVAAGNSAIVRYNTDGSRDTTFDGDGIVTIAISATTIAIQSDGKILTAGSSVYNIICYPDKEGGEQCYGQVGFAIVRHNPTGSLDTTFDADGIVSTPIGPGYDSASTVLIQPDGKIVAAGYTSAGSSDFAIVRYNTNGSLDVTFDGDGKVTTEVGPTYDFAYQVAIQSDGKLIVAGASRDSSNSDDFALVRYNADGSLDGIFDGDGKVITAISSSFDSAYGVAIQQDGKIVAVGYGGTASADFTLVRYNTNGSLDASGFSGGIVTADIGTGYLDAADDIAIQSDGKIVAVSSRSNAFAVVRYDPDGSLDTTFDGDGKVATAFDSIYARGRAVVIQSDGKIVVAGTVSEGGLTGDIAIVRYNSDGSLDTTFDGDGRVITSIGAQDDSADAVAIQSDGKIVAAGYSRTLSSVSNFALVRYNTDGSLDTTFDGDGKLTTGSRCDVASAVVVQPDGKIIAAGSGWNDLNDFALARYNTDGSLDSTFDGDGIVITAISSSPPTTFRDSFRDSANAVAIQPDGKIVAAGTSGSDSSNYGFALVRYNPDGSLDTTFDTDGKVTTAIGNANSGSSAVAIQTDGRIIAAGQGSIPNSPSDSDFALVRYNTNGTLDATFGGGDGISTVDFNTSYDGARGMALHSRGCAVVAGQANGALAIARVLLEPNKTRFDFDGDGRSDISVFRPSDSVWYIDRSFSGFTAAQFGISTDKITPADYDGDGKTDISIFRDGTWWRINSGNSTVAVAQFGIAGDIPVPGDYNGDGRDELAVYRNGEWWLEGTGRTAFGTPTDKPVPADYDGDGKTDISIYRDGAWWRIKSSDSTVSVVQFGIATDRPVIGDYDGDSRADLAVYRDGTWHILRTTGGYTAFNWGLATDTPTAADYDGDGRTDAAVYRNGTWYLLQSTGGVAIRQFGLANDTPVPAAFVN
jgi:uncharacterized delta-60 repeat protein